MTPELKAALYRWDAASKALQAAIAEELAARTAVVEFAFPAPLEGVNNVPLEGGYVLQGTFRNNYSLDNKTVEAALKQLPKPVQLSLVSWDAKLKVGGYKALEPAHKAIINEVLTIKPGRPAIEIITPKVA